MSGSEVQLHLQAWPTYVGVTDGTHEPAGDYRRGAIQWSAQPDGQILGCARIWAPKGTWTHYVFYSGPQDDATVMGIATMEHPIIFDRAGVIDVDPIHNHDVLPRIA